MKTATYSSPFPIVFICDFSNRHQVIPEYDDSAVASATDSCVSIRTVSEIDGEVTIAIADELSSDITGDGIEVFSGHIEAPGGRIAFVDSEDKKLLESEPVGPRPFVRVLVDDEQFPTRVWAEVK